MNNICAPNINIKEHYTCFELEELKSIAKTFNDYILKNKRCPKLGKVNVKRDKNYCILDRIIETNNKTKEELWNSIYKRLEPICKYEYCWLDLDFVSKIKDVSLREKILYFTFKPKMTMKIDSWLSTKDINNVLQQYQDNYNFKFLGALPSDFYKITMVNYNDIYNYKKIGFVLNLDDHTKGGSHWVALLIDNTLKTIEYYDSAGKRPNKNIQNFITKVYNFVKKHNKYTIKYNTTTHQLKNTECGVYAIHFIIKRIIGVPFDTICNDTIPDEQMAIFRYYIFRPRGGTSPLLAS
jgi:hypothetical protein